MVTSGGLPLRSADEGSFFIDPLPYLYPAALDSEYLRDLKVVAATEARLRVAETALAVELWRMEHGRWPGQPR